jgi:hypothetical protein
MGWPSLQISRFGYYLEINAPPGGLTQVSDPDSNGWYSLRNSYRPGTGIGREQDLKSVSLYARETTGPETTEMSNMEYTDRALAVGTISYMAADATDDSPYCIVANPNGSADDEVYEDAGLTYYTDGYYRAGNCRIP